MVTDQEYPVRPAFSLLLKILELFVQKIPRSMYQDPKKVAENFPEVQQFLQQYQDPKQADAIMRVQAELDETKVVLHKTIESVLARGEKLDDLVQRSDALSNQSKRFYQTAKKVNTICNSMCYAFSFLHFPPAKLLLCCHVIDIPQFNCSLCSRHLDFRHIVPGHHNVSYQSIYAE